MLPKEDLLNALHLEFINRVNEVGVDVNKAVTNPHTAALVQFISGLGPRKGGALLKVRPDHNMIQVVSIKEASPGCGFVKLFYAQLSLAENFLC